VHSSLSIAPILQPTDAAEGGQDAPSINDARIRPNGAPLITLTNGCAYMYSMDMKAWMCVADPWYAVMDYTPLSSDLIQAVAPAGPLKTLQSFAAHYNEVRESNIMTAQRLANADTTTESSLALSFLEAQMEACRLLHSLHEYVFWLHQYAARLARDGNEVRTQQLCSDLYGPVPVDARWQPTLLGHGKRQLLQDILPLLSSSNALQRIVHQYQS
jgi:protein HIRA/HIR1